MRGWRHFLQNNCCSKPVWIRVYWGGNGAEVSRERQRKGKKRGHLFYITRSNQNARLRNEPMAAGGAVVTHAKLCSPQQNVFAAIWHWHFGTTVWGSGARQWCSGSTRMCDKPSLFQHSSVSQCIGHKVPENNWKRWLVPEDPDATLSNE